MAIAVVHGHAVAPLEHVVEAAGRTIRLILSAARAVGGDVHATARAPAALLAISKLWAVLRDDGVEQRRARDVRRPRPAARGHNGKMLSCDDKKWVSAM